VTDFGIVSNDFKINAVLLNFLFTKEKKYHTDNNNKCFLSTLKAFLKDHVILKTGIMSAENSALQSEE